jgi:hypothetical protein
MGDPPSATGDGGGAVSGSSGSAGSTGGNAGRGGDASAGDSSSAGTSGVGGGVRGPWWQKTNTDGCDTEGKPSKADRPDIQDTTSLAPFYLAQTRIRFGTTDDDDQLTPNVNAWRDIGFDFDGHCTNSPTCFLNNDPSDPVNKFVCANPTATDGNKCRDNQIGKIFKFSEGSSTVGDLFGLSEHDWNCELHRGGFSIIFKISEYNGQLNDPLVRFDMYNSIGVEELPSWKCRGGADGGPDITGDLDARWPGYTSWPSNAKFLIPERNMFPGWIPIPGQLPDAAVSDATAFVKNGILVAELPNDSEMGLLGLRSAVPGFRMRLDRGLLAMELSKNPDDNTWIAAGTVSGVVTPGLMLDAFEELGFCENMCGSYRQVRDYFDVNKDALRDETVAPSVPCTHLTYASTLRARQASVNTTIVTSLPGFGPIPGYGVPLNEQCPNPRHPAAPRKGCSCPGGGSTLVCP